MQAFVSMIACIRKVLMPSTLDGPERLTQCARSARVARAGRRRSLGRGTLTARLDRRHTPRSVGAVTSPTELASAIRSGDRTALARGITLVESARAADVTAAETLLQTLLPATGGSVRIGITGAPGVGKSTLIEALGMRLCAAGRRVCISLNQIGVAWWV